MKLSPLALIFVPVFMFGQQTVAPTAGESTTPARGVNSGNYNIVQQWELGYRYASVGGDEGAYRADVNYRNGVRLLNSYLTVNSRDGHGHWFDEITLITQGLGNDPYETATFRIQKNRIYRYDLLWRSNQYFNPGLTPSNGEHLSNTTRRWQDHEITLLPQNWYRFRAGYARNVEDGPALNTTTVFDPQGTAYPTFRDVRRQFNEYRLGGDVTRGAYRLTILRRWEMFKEDTTDDSTVARKAASVPFSPAGDLGVLQSFQNAQPFRGDTRSWLGNVSGETKWLAVNGRFTYAAGRGDFVQNESSLGTDRFAVGQNRQVLVTGSGVRPVLTGDLTLSLFPVSRLTVTNLTSISNTRINGSNLFVQFDNGSRGTNQLNFQFLGIRLITNATEVKYRFTKRLSVFAGIRWSDREIRSIEDQAAAPDQPFTSPVGSRSNTVVSGTAGVNWILMKDLRMNLETEVGRDDNAFSPISLANYHSVRSRLQYRKKAYTISGGYQQNYNNNSIQISAYSSRSRVFNSAASWAPNSKLSLDASYSKLHLDTIGGLNFFAGTPRAVPVLNQSSIYISNIHSGNLGIRIAVHQRADFYAGYSITKDTGGVLTGTLTGGLSTSPLPAATYSTYPLTYQTPLLRLSVQITPKLRYNLGYQYYGYHEQFGLLSQNQSYRANTGFTSLLWSF